MSSEENKAIVRRVFDAFNAHQYDQLDDLMTPELAQEMKGLGTYLDATFANPQVTITELVAEDDKVMVLFTVNGGHSGEVEGIPPTNKQWTGTSFEFYRLADGKVVEYTGVLDMLNVLKQLGATITPAA